MTGPLEGVRIIDVTSVISGPYATMMLGDQGADVIKIESPGIGDFTRFAGSVRNGISPIFATVNRSKRSVVLNLKDARGVDLLKRLVQGADVFIQNFRPGAIERMGLGEEVLREVRPDLIYVSITGFGDSGPYARKRVYDPIIQALSGLMAIQRDLDSGKPQSVRTILPDKLTAVTAAQAITAALYARSRTGEGQHVRLSMLDATIAWLWPDVMRDFTWLEDSQGTGISLSDFEFTFQTTDGWIAMIILSDAEWSGFARAAGHPEWAEDERFQNLAARIANLEALRTLMGETLSTASTKEWIERLEREDVPCALIRTPEEILDDPQVVANELIVESEHPHAGRMRQPRPPARLTRTPAEIRRPAPAQGEHGDEVLSELGLSAEEIGALREAAVVG